MKQIEIKVDTGAASGTQDTLFGVFIEDLSHALDGGLYGELVQNRSFEYEAEANPEYSALTAWEAVERGDSFVQLHTETVSPYHPNNPHYLVVESIAADRNGCGVQNAGYDTGIPVKKGAEYVFSCICRVRKGTNPVLQVKLEAADGKAEYAAESVTLDSGDWKRYACRLTASQSDFCGRLTLLLTEPAILHLDRVSLFPAETFQQRENGLRRDLAEMIADLKPAFVRFPGGCLTHVGTLDSREKSSVYRWKNTLGPVEERQEKRNVLWQYQQSFGMGVYEFFLFCEDLGAEPIPVVSAGHDPHFLRTAQEDELQEWIDEALDLIEFANGSAESKWGSVRARMGHPESFCLKYLMIGNEEVGEGYTRNYDVIAGAVREKYPEIRLMNSVITCAYQGKPEGGMEQAVRTGTPYTDFHTYAAPEWFLANAHQFTGGPEEPKVFFGEYSSCDDTWYNALAEAAFMTGVEKTDGIAFLCYAPLLNHVAYSNWKPDMIHFDNHRCYGTPCYYAHKLFMNHQGDRLLSTEDNIAGGKLFCKRPGGTLKMSVNLAEIAVRDFKVTGKESGRTERLADFELNPQNPEMRCADNLGGDFTASFTFIRKEAPGTPAHRGKYAVTVSLGEENGPDKILCTIDGWQRLTTISGKVGTYKTHQLCRIRSGVEYAVRLCVENNVVSIYIDGELCGSFENRDVVPRELYYSAVQNSAGDTIVKLVNVLPEEKQVSLSFADGKDHTAALSIMDGCSPDARNSLEEPFAVSPKERQAQIRKGKLECRVAGYSITVIRVPAL